MRVLASVVACLMLTGCNRSQPPGQTPGITMEQEYLTVIGHDGERKVIPVGELKDHDTGAPTAKSIWVIDRRTGKKAWVAIEKFLSEPPSTARYIPVTQTKPPAKMD